MDRRVPFVHTVARTTCSARLHRHRVRVVLSTDVGRAALSEFERVVVATYEGLNRISGASADNGRSGNGHQGRCPDARVVSRQRVQAGGVRPTFHDDATVSWGGSCFDQGVPGQGGNDYAAWGRERCEAQVRGSSLRLSAK